MQICQNNKNEIDNDVSKIVNYTQVICYLCVIYDLRKNKAIQLLPRLDPIARALDGAQRDETISLPVEIWNRFEKDFENEIT